MTADETADLKAAEEAVAALVVMEAGGGEPAPASGGAGGVGGSSGGGDDGSGGGDREEAAAAMEVDDEAAMAMDPEPPPPNGTLYKLCLEYSHAARELAEMRAQRDGVPSLLPPLPPLAHLAEPGPASVRPRIQLCKLVVDHVETLKSRP